MKNIILFVAITVSLLLAGCAQPEPVKTKKVTKEFVEYGKKRIDNYYWLNNRADSAVIEHLRAENVYTEAMLKHTEGLQKTIYDELVARIEQKYESLPRKEKGYWYNIRYEEGKQYPLYCRRKGDPAAAEEVYLNVPQMAVGHQIFMVRGFSVSPGNSWIAYGIDTTGDRRCTLYMKNLATSDISPIVISNTSGSYEWANDNRTLFYVVNDRTIRAFKVMKHTLGTDPNTDRELYRELDSTFSVSLSSTRDHKYIFIECGSTLTGEWRYLAADRPDAAPVLIQPRTHDVLYSLEDHEGDKFYIHTNKDAKNFKLVSAPLRNPGMANWKDVIPHRSDALLQQVAVFTNYIVALQKIGGLTQILVIDRKNGESHYVDFAEQAYVAGMYAATDAYDLDSIRYTYTSLTSPRSDYIYNLRSRQKVLLKQEKVGGGFDASLYETRRIMATAADGVKVPISIVYKKSLFKHDGSNPMLLYAYGSYGASMEPYFSSSVFSLLDRGFVYGIGHIRGGQEMGRQWYEDGKLLKKKNTFSDFIACAQYLVDEKYTSRERLYANGGSA
jgi:oligopeptidase B